MTKETDAILAYFSASGAGGCATDLNTPNVHAAHSYHYLFGNWARPIPLDKARPPGQVGCAVDFGFPVGQVDSPGLRAIFCSFAPVEHLLAELIHTSAPYFVHEGKRYGIGQLDPAVAAAHHNHVHVAVHTGTLLPAPAAPVPIPEEHTLPSQVDVAMDYFKPLPARWVLTSDGGVRADGGAPFLGSVPMTHPQGQRSFVAIEALRDEEGYVCFGDDDSYYVFNWSWWQANQPK